MYLCIYCTWWAIVSRPPKLFMYNFHNKQQNFIKFQLELHQDIETAVPNCRFINAVITLQFCGELQADLYVQNRCICVMMVGGVHCRQMHQDAG